jgi:hypothetical protein
LQVCIRATTQRTSYISVLHEPHLQGSVEEISLGFFDDILVYSKTWQEHMRQLDEILSIIEAQSLYAKESKCEFGMTELLYLGHIISAQGVQVQQEKIGAILDWPTPRSVTKLRSFFRLCSYYRQFVRGFSQLGAPLTDLTKHGAFNWIDDS